MTVDLRYYSAALDEIYRLRGLLALEAAVLSAHLEYATFPKSRRPFAEEQVKRMRAAAQGRSTDSLSATTSRAMWTVRNDLGIETLTRTKYEREVDAQP